MADTEVQTNLDAAVAPTVNDDSGDGYSIFSPWVDVIAARVYFAANVTVGAAVWRQAVIGSATSGSATEILTDDGAGGFTSESALTFDGSSLNVAAGASVTGVNIDLDATPSDAITVIDSGAVTVFVVDGNGNIGKGTASPGADIDLAEDSTHYIRFNEATSNIVFRNHAQAANIFKVDDGAISQSIALSVGASQGNTNFSTVVALSSPNRNVAPGGVTIGTKTDASTDIVPGNVSLFAIAAFATASTNLDGGNIALLAGDGASGSAGDADGGNVLLDGGGSFGTGDDGDVVLQTVNAGNVGIHVSDPAEDLQVADAIAISSEAEGGTARLTRRSIRELHTLTLGASSDTTAISIPTGARFLGTSTNVNVAVTNDGDNTWKADWITGSTQAIAAAGTAATQNTKVDSMHPIYELASATAEIRFTPQSGNFTAGVIEIVAYYETLTSLADV